MEVKNYLELYYGDNPKSSSRIERLELTGRILALQVANNLDVDESMCLEFINEVETWKAMDIPGRIIGVGQNTASMAKSAVLNSLKATSKKDQIEAFHTLHGFGISKNNPFNKRPAKVASAAVRFLSPKHWGVVDWRSAAIAQSFDGETDVNVVKRKASSHDKSDWKRAYSMIDSHLAVQLNQKYQQIGAKFGIAENAVVDQFLFGVSLSLWPIKATKSTCKKYCYQSI